MKLIREHLKERNRQIKDNVKDADEYVLSFITDFATHAAINENEYEIICSTFRTGYCWHFAVMLKAVFGRGCVCWAAPFGHFVWMDDNNVPYDIEGVYFGEAVYYIPESYLGDALKDFIRIPGIGHDATKEEIMDIIHRYENDNGFTHQDGEILKFLKP